MHACILDDFRVSNMDVYACLNAIASEMIYGLSQAFETDHEFTCNIPSHDVRLEAQACLHVTLCTRQHFEHDTTGTHSRLERIFSSAHVQ